MYARVTNYADEIKAHLPSNAGAGSIQLTASGLPSGATAGFAPSSVDAGGSSTLTIATSASTPPGTYQQPAAPTVTVTDSGGAKQSTSFYWFVYQV